MGHLQPGESDDNGEVTIIRNRHPELVSGSIVTEE